MTQPFGGGTHEHGRDIDPDGEAPVIRDRRRIDPTTGKLREQPPSPDKGAPVSGSVSGSASQSAGAAGLTGSVPEDEFTADALASEELDRLQKLVDERTLDLQRLQAEYVNYRRRVDRDRTVASELATAKAATDLLPVLDDIARAEQHGELTGGFKAVADSLTRSLDRMGVTRYGEPGDAFDPSVHEALMHQVSDDVDGPTATAILQPGYRLGERILRPARVAVSEPSHGGQPAADPADTASDDTAQNPETD